MSAKEQQEKPAPQRSRLTAPFWEAAAQQKLLLQFDPATGRCQFYPRPLSLFSDSGKLEWKESSGRGTLVAFTVVHSPAKGYENEAPYLAGIIRLDEGPRFFARIVNADAASLRAGQRMRVAWATPPEAHPQRMPCVFEPGN
jgi:uncharacterized OB-fold protein